MRLLLCGRGISRSKALGQRVIQSQVVLGSKEGHAVRVQTLGDLAQMLLLRRNVVVCDGQESPKNSADMAWVLGGGFACGKAGEQCRGRGRRIQACGG